MDTTATRNFEESLLTVIGSAMRATGKVLKRTEPVRASLRAALTSRRLSDRERQALSVEAMSDDFREVINHFVQIRVQAALDCGMRTALENSSSPKPVEPPWALVAWSEGTPSADELSLGTEVCELVASQTKATTTAPSSAPRRGPIPSYVLLADRASADVYEDSGQLAEVDHVIGPEGLLHADERDYLIHSIVTPGELHFLSDACRSIAVCLRPASNTTIATKFTILRPDGSLGRADSRAATVPDGPGRKKVTDELVGKLFDRKYHLRALLGVGGFGAVYEALDVHLGCPVAVKVLKDEVSGGDNRIATFRAEARKLTRLKHPNIVDWKALSVTDSGCCYFVMEMLQGESLESVLRRQRRFRPRRAARILLQILDALRAAHYLGDDESILHLDLKPANVFLEPPPGGATGDWVKVIDFGISQHIKREMSPREAAGDAQRRSPFPGKRGSEDELDDPFLEEPTRVGGCTPLYAAPEQGAHLLLDQRVVALDERADLYALGIMGFEMLTGKVPFSTHSDVKVLLRTKLREDPPRVAYLGQRIPRRLATFVDRCICREREDRWSSTIEAYDALRSIVHPPVWRRSALWTAIFVAMATALTWFLVPTTVKSSFDLFDVATERNLAGAVVYLGPERPWTRLRLAGIALGTETEIRLVREPGDTGAVPGWSVAVENEALIRIQSTTRAGRVQHSVYLEARSGDTPSRYSEPFKLVWLGADVVRLETVEIPGLEGRSLDLESQQCRVVAIGRRSDIASIELRYSSNAYQATWDRNVSGGGQVTYSVPLEGLGLTNGHHELDIRMVDRAGGTRTRRIPLHVWSTPLEFQGASLNCAQRGGRYLIPPNREPELRFALNGKADVRWTARDESGRAFLQGERRGVQNGTVRLTGLSDSPGRPSFAGAIELVADDGRHVSRAHPVERGRSSRTLKFYCSDTTPRISVRLYRPRDGSEVELSPDRPFFVDKSEIRLRVLRENVLPLDLSAVVRRRDLPVEEGIEVEMAMDDASERSIESMLSLPGEGCYDLVVRGWSYPDEVSRDLRPDVTVEGQIVFDGTPARIRVDGAERMLVLESREKPGCVVGVLDESGPGCEAPPPVDVRWELVRKKAPSRVVSRGDLGRVSNQRPVNVAFPSPPVRNSLRESADGIYTLLFNGTDLCGNEAVSAGVDFEVARDGPWLEVLRPAPSLPWTPDASGRFEVRVLCDDPNEVRGVRVELKPEDGDDLSLEMRRDTAKERLSVWHASIRIPLTWAESTIELSFMAEDARGNTTLLSQHTDMGSVLPGLPPRIAIQRSGRNLGYMRHVAGNSSAPYVFGGRADETEARLFEKAGLDAYNPLRVARSWQVVYARGELRDFYLAECEVSVADYREFLESGDGYENPSNWAERALPHPKRRTVLHERLAREPADSPVRGVTWDEALAYARWIGMRLPSFVEWEYAVRGGVLYRPYASYVEGNPDNQPNKTVASQPIVLEGTWPVRGHGVDRTPTGIWNLCTNVSEWTTTAAAAAGNPARHAAANRENFLRPNHGSRSEGFELCWVVGGSFRDRSPDFSTVDSFPPDWRGETVGFRCCISAEDIADRLNVRKQSGPTFIEVRD